MGRLADPPLRDSVVVAAERMEQDKLPKLQFGLNFIKWLGELTQSVDASSSVLARERLAAQNASIGVTPINTGTLEAGRYRVSYWVKVTTPGTISSSLQFLLHWTRSVIALTFTGAAEAGNALNTYQSAPIEVYVDEDTPISYSTVYASAGATPMEYELDILVERLAVDTN